eukprot:3963653-Prymnesium_polylepis.1
MRAARQSFCVLRTVLVLLKLNLIEIVWAYTVVDWCLVSPHTRFVKRLSVVRLYGMSSTYKAVRYSGTAQCTLESHVSRYKSESVREDGTAAVLTITITINPYPDNPTHVGSPSSEGRGPALGTALRGDLRRTRNSSQITSVSGLQPSSVRIGLRSPLRAASVERTTKSCSRSSCSPDALS